MKKGRPAAKKSTAAPKRASAKPAAKATKSSSKPAPKKKASMPMMKKGGKMPKKYQDGTIGPKTKEEARQAAIDKIYRGMEEEHDFRMAGERMRKELQAGIPQDPEARKAYDREQEAAAEKERAKRQNKATWKYRLQPWKRTPSWGGENYFGRWPYLHGVNDYAKGGKSKTKSASKKSAPKMAKGGKMKGC